MASVCDVCVWQKSCMNRRFIGLSGGWKAEEYKSNGGVVAQLSLDKQKQQR